MKRPIASEITGRVCHAIELLGQYVDVAIQRWQQFTGKTAMLDRDGRSFEAVAAERKPGES
jgi:DNA modification methylase